jgi:hypothetical protein
VPPCAGRGPLCLRRRFTAATRHHPSCSPRRSRTTEPQQSSHSAHTRHTPAFSVRRAPLDAASPARSHTALGSPRPIHLHAPCPLARLVARARPNRNGKDEPRAGPATRGTPP